MSFSFNLFLCLQDTRFYYKRKIQLILRFPRKAFKIPSTPKCFAPFLMVSDCLSIHDILVTCQQCCHPGRVKTMKTEQTEMENVVLIFNSSC